MSFRRLNADGLYRRNLLVAFAFRQELENFATSGAITDSSISY